MSEGTARNLVMKKADPFTGEYRRTPGFVKCSECGFHGMVYEYSAFSDMLGADVVFCPVCGRRFEDD